MKYPACGEVSFFLRKTQKMETEQVEKIAPEKLREIELEHEKEAEARGDQREEDIAEEILKDFQ